jgi:hypothetical protein
MTLLFINITSTFKQVLEILHTSVAERMNFLILFLFNYHSFISSI